MKNHRLGLFLLSSLILSITACQSLAAPERTQQLRGTLFPPSAAALPGATATSTYAPPPTAMLPPTITDEPYTLVLNEPATEVTFRIPLTLQDIGTTSATLSFELSSPHAGSLFLWNTAGPVAERPFSVDRTTFIFTFQELQPGEEYVAAVGLIDDAGGYSALLFQDQEWGAVQIRTLNMEQEQVRIAVLGDSGFGRQTTYQLIDRIATYDIDFVIHSGDVVYNIHEDKDAPTAYAKKFYLPFSPLLHRMPVYPVVGNHDVEDASLWEGKPFYYYAFPLLEEASSIIQGSPEQRDWYALPVGEVQMLMLNSQSFFGAGGYEEQTRWLRDRLEDERYVASIPVFHVAAHTSGMHSRDGIPIRQNWSPLFQQANVPLVISGHDHNYERLVVNEITYVVTGGGSSVLYNQREIHPSSKIFARRTHFVLLELFSDRIELTSIALDGEILDRATIPLDAR